MSKIDDGGPAFARAAHEGESSYDDGCLGMSLRDYFAGQAIAGLLACDSTSGTDAADFATVSYEVADAMLAVRKAKD